MAILVVFDGPPEKAVESLVAEVVSEDEDEDEDEVVVMVVDIVWVDMGEDEVEIDGVVQGVGVSVGVDDSDGYCELAASTRLSLGAGFVVNSLTEGGKTVPG
ncbi:hypothetical protein ACN38_g9723 [Penicillium nordicum]|uniref:Uncharacterized protein n=1 Tax=Penicillium nordicum TaxID=229535 RepID=A0A0M8NU37_9EURO|nr:hypothetical protein ACN38_g9723 [Penicillium nordicum]